MRVRPRLPSYGGRDRRSPKGGDNKLGALRGKARVGGFTLVEVLVAMAVLLVGLLATAPLVSQAVVRGGQARKLTAAQLLGQEILERLRAEVRYDSNAASSPDLAPEDAWRFDVLPHAPDRKAKPEGCQPPGLDDGVPYDYGPFRFLREDERFDVCYRLEEVNPADPETSALPVGSVRATVRVMWRAPDGGWSSWSVGDLLVSGV